MGGVGFDALEGVTWGPAALKDPAVQDVTRGLPPINNAAGRGERRVRLLLLGLALRQSN